MHVRALLADLLASAQHDAHDLGEPRMLRTSGILEASFTAPWGDLHTAERQADDALALGPRDGGTNAATVHGAHLVVVRWHLGSLPDLLPLVRGPPLGGPTSRPSRRATHSPKPSRAIAHAPRPSRVCAFPHTSARLPAACAQAAVAVELAEPAPVAVLYDQLRS
jgi:hypothetical protein